MIGDATLFQRADQVESAWTIVDPILKEWAKDAPTDFPNYAAGGEPTLWHELLGIDGGTAERSIGYGK